MNTDTTQIQEQEIKPWPLIGYAPGNYMSQCATCQKQIGKVDKLCFMCLECASIEIQRYAIQLKEENAIFREALQKIDDDGYDAYDNNHHLTVQRWISIASEALSTNQIKE